MKLAFLFLPGLLPVLAVTREVGPGQTYTTIQACLNVVSAGDICNVHAGTYTEQLTLPISGSVGNVITLQNNIGDTVMVQSSSSPVVSIANRSYWTITGLSVTYTGSGSNPIVINQSYSGVGVNPVNGLTISNCILTLSGGTGNGFGVYIPNSDGLTMTGNTIAITSSTGTHDGIDLLYTSNLEFSGNTIYGNASESTGKLEDGMVVSGTNLNVENNILHDGWSFDNHPDAIVIQGDGNRSGANTGNVKVWRNTIYNFTQGVYFDAIHNNLEGTNWIIDNVIYETSAFRYGGAANKMNCVVLDGESISGPQYTINALVYNNTLGCKQLLIYTLRQLSSGGSSIDFQNNIFITPTFTGLQLTSIAGLTLNYNYYSQGDSTPIKWGSTNYSLAAYKSATGQETNSQTGIVNLNSDFSENASSLSRGVGSNLTGTFTVDILNFTRPSSGAWDMGAYQFQALPAGSGTRGPRTTKGPVTRK